MNIWLGQRHPPQFPQGAAVTIGNFDGVHLGHKHILQKLKREADQRGLPVVVIDQLLRQTLNTRYLLIGDDFRFGAGREGCFELLAQQPDMQTERTPSVIVEDIRTSSTAVRQALSDGKLEYAKKLLGHDYVLSGKVKHGQKLGRTINAPTANVQLPPYHYALSGVFVVEADGTFGTRRGVASFGFNPTVSNNRSQKLEVHLFDFNGDLYGQRIFVRFLHKLRDEKKFESIEALKTQILQDMEDARVWEA